MTGHDLGLPTLVLYGDQRAELLGDRLVDLSGGEHEVYGVAYDASRNVTEVWTRPVVDKVAA